MKKLNWKNLLERSVEEADALGKISSHQKYIDRLYDYEGRIIIDGDSYSVDVLKLLYLEAYENVCSPAVLDLLSSFDKRDTAEELVNDILLDLAVTQKKKTRFLGELSRYFRKKQPAKIYRGSFEKLSQSSVEDALSELGLTVRLNLVTKKIEIGGSGSDYLFEIYSRANILNVLPIIILDHLVERNVRALGQGTKQIEKYLFNIADQNRYNPIHEMFEKHENDDEGNLSVLYAILGITDEFDRLLVYKWFLQTTALAFNKIDNPISTEGVLVLQGKQGCGKTTFFRKFSLNPEWFTEGAVIDIKNKDTIITALSTWICELGEIDSTLKREQSALKAFITRPIDRIRFPYAPAESELVRNTSMCGTVNPNEFLNDTTGSRRYWVVAVEDIEVKYLLKMSSEDIKNIWGYFYHKYKENPDGFRLSFEEQETLGKRNNRYNCELKYEAEVLDLLDFNLPERDWIKVTSAKLAVFIQGASAVQIGKILSKLSDTDERIVKDHSGNGRFYYLPVKKRLYDTLKMNG
ncbi:MAG: VapE domain-containing protein [Ruminococcus sp.]|nr:VapE domain-containing protein [Ruminococcus sp.]